MGSLCCICVIQHEVDVEKVYFRCVLLVLHNVRLTSPEFEFVVFYLVLYNVRSTSPKYEFVV